MQCEASKRDGGGEPGGVEAFEIWHRLCFRVRINQCDNSTLQLIN